MLGAAWLRTTLDMPALSSRVESSLGSRLREHEQADGRKAQVFPASYAVPDDPLAHVVFSLKYEGVDLLLLKGVFERLPARKVSAFVQNESTGIYARKIGFLYEFLTGTTLSLGKTVIGGNYVSLLDEREYVTAEPRNVPRWRVRDNLPGTPAFCPTIRLTQKLSAGLRTDWRAKAAAVLKNTPRPLLDRALGYFYAKETRSSFLIEREAPGAGKQERFIAALREAGNLPSAGESLEVGRLVALQNKIVDPRYRETAFRTVQNYVGETLHDFSERVHYVCPPPDAASALWRGVVESAKRLEAAPPLVQAAAVAFSFVFIHPFLDGNGRIHRFLLQDTLARRHLLSDGVLIPLSASILADLPAYDKALETFSKPVIALADYVIERDRSLTLRNGDELLPLWQYPDLTAQTEYLHAVLEHAIASIPEEVEFLRRHDAMRSAITGIVDLPARKLDLLLTLLRENAGCLSRRKRGHFAELADTEVARIESAYKEVWQIATKK
ncbi:Fic family protein [Ereboglobus sp. PH5-10]|uniref:Fic family protein n=1 Tax=Ereboglobus sp. PH5-10 TaxID=2940629 RepID=UPI002405CC81|nr:Fic family protein [Ereboglobus sp. PH5-10]